MVAANVAAIVAANVDTTIIAIIVKSSALAFEEESLTDGGGFDMMIESILAFRIEREQFGSLGTPRAQANNHFQCLYDRFDYVDVVKVWNRSNNR